MSALHSELDLLDPLLHPQSGTSETGGLEKFVKILEQTPSLAHDYVKRKDPELRLLLRRIRDKSEISLLSPSKVENIGAVMEALRTLLQCLTPERQWNLTPLIVRDCLGLFQNVLHFSVSSSWAITSSFRRLCHSILNLLTALNTANSLVLFRNLRLEFVGRLWIGAAVLPRKKKMAHVYPPRLGVFVTRPTLALTRRSRRVEGRGNKFI